MNVHPSSLKHGVHPEDSIQAATLPLWVEDLDDEHPGRELRIGFDTTGRLLEVVVLTFDSGKQLIIHSMKARPQMLDLLP